jgi:outer membrane protein TolC
MLTVYCGMVVAQEPMAEGGLNLNLSPALPGDLDALLRELDTPPVLPPWVAEERAVVIGTVSGGPRERPGLRQRFEQEIRELVGAEFEVHFPEEYQIDGDWTLAGVNAAIEQLMTAAAVDIVVCYGVVPSTALLRRGPLPKPGIAAHVPGAAALGAPEQAGASGVRNLAYLSLPNPLVRDLVFFREMIPFTRVAILASQDLLDFAPVLRENAVAALESEGFEVTVVAVGAEPAPALAALPEGVEAVYLAPLLMLSTDEFVQLLDGISARGLPAFSLLGGSEVELGALASLRPAADDGRLARRVALYVQRILLGERPETLPIALPAGERLTLNMATARAIGYYPTWAVLSEALLINEAPVEVRHAFTLRSAVDRALEANRDFEASALGVEAGAHDITAARANLLPRVDASTTAVVIDEDLAGAFQPERAWSGSLTVQQVVYDERAHANVYITKRLQEALEHAHAGTGLDVVQLAAQAYFNVLRAATFEHIRKNNLRLTREHLELAQVRMALGTAGPGEGYRWESQLAQARIETMDATAKRAAAQVDLMRILHLPQEDTFSMAEVGIDDALLTPTRQFAEQYLDNPHKFTVFRDFMVEEGLQRAPELMQFDSGISARERARLAAERSFYVPTVGLQGEVKRDFAFGGVGTGSGGLSSLLMPPPEEDTTWTLALQATLPLYTGGARQAARSKARIQVEQLGVERAATHEKIEERIRVAAHSVRASFANIRHAESASMAAHQNLDLVTDAYARGVASAIDLLDAQNAALVAELSVAGITYQFYVDLMEMERASANFIFRMTQAEYGEWLTRLAAYFDLQGISAPSRP